MQTLFLVVYMVCCFFELQTELVHIFNYFHVRGYWMNRI